MSSYLVTTKNLNDFFNAIITARAPERFSHTFLQQLEFTSSNDRLFVGILKGLGFLDESSTPRQRYYDFLDQTQSGIVLAEAIREAYSDLFALNKHAHTMNVDEVKNKFRSLTQGQKSDNVISLMANTFKALCDYANWDTTVETKKVEKKEQKDVNQSTANEINKASTEPTQKDKSISPTLHYNIQIHLPESRDPAVFDAIFRSLKEHLL
jgi:hypothetical protein